MTDLGNSISAALAWCRESGVEVPLDIQVKAISLGAVKLAGDLTWIGNTYHAEVTQTLIGYFEGGSLAVARNRLKQLAVESLGAAYDMGWRAGGGSFPLTPEALDWLNARIEKEFGYIADLIQQAKELRKEEGFDWFAWVSDRADGYSRTLRELYNAAKMRAMPNQMAIFAGEDGAESCADCQHLKGKRHRLSWFVARNYVPPAGTGLECHPGRRCQHYLMDEQGNQITI